MLSAAWRPLAVLWLLPAGLVLAGLAGGWQGMTALGIGLLAGLALSGSI